MTTHLGMAFYATLVALVCAIIYLFFRAGANRLQSGVVREYKQRVRSTLLAQVASTTSVRSPTVVQEPAVLSAKPDHVAPATLSPAPHMADEVALLAAAALLKRLGQGDVFAIWPTGKPPGSLLAAILVAYKVATPDQWKSAVVGPLAFAVPSTLIGQLPPHIRDFAWLLYFYELRPAQAALNQFGLSSSLKVIQPERFEAALFGIVRGWGLALFKGRERRAWISLSDATVRPAALANQSETLTNRKLAWMAARVASAVWFLRSQLSRLLTVCRSERLEAAFVGFVRGCGLAGIQDRLNRAWQRFINGNASTQPTPEIRLTTESVTQQALLWSANGGNAVVRLIRILAISRNVPDGPRLFQSLAASQPQFAVHQQASGHGGNEQ